MKKIAVLFVIFLVSGYVLEAQKVFEDELYVSNKNRKVLTEKKVDKTEQAAVVNRMPTSFDYNRVEDTYTALLEDDAITDIDTIIYVSPEKANYAASVAQDKNAQELSVSGYELSETISRFGESGLTVVSSGENTSYIYLLDDSDWGVYTSGDVIYAHRSNPVRVVTYNYYDPYYYYPYSSWYFGWGGSWVNWGYSYRPYSWYRPYYSWGYGGWNYPRCGGYYGHYYDGYYYDGYYGGGYYASRNRGSRNNYTSRRNSSRNVYANRVARNSRGERVSRVQSGRSATASNRAGTVRSSSRTSSGRVSASRSASDRSGRVYTSTREARPRVNVVDRTSAGDGNRVGRPTRDIQRQQTVGRETTSQGGSRARRATSSSTPTTTRERRQYTAPRSSSQTRSSSDYPRSRSSSGSSSEYSPARSSSRQSGYTPSRSSSSSRSSSYGSPSRSSSGSSRSSSGRGRR